MFVLVTGANGQLGKSLNRLVNQNITDYRFVFSTRDELDLTDFKYFRGFIEKNQFDVIINCAAFTAVDKSELEKENANRVNHLAVKNIAEKCGISNEKLTVILTPTSSLAGSVQIVSRVLETSLHKAHELNFPLDKIIDGAGSAPLCPPSNDFLTAMSRTNDAILFAGQIQLFVEANDEDAKELANALPSSASKDYGKPFGEIFKDVKYDFYKIDPMLFSPARVAVSSLLTGHTFHAGKIDLELLEKSFS